LHEDLVASIDVFQAFALTGVQWHNAVAKASGNSLRGTFIYSISDRVTVTTMVEEYETMDTREVVARVHALRRSLHCRRIEKAGIADDTRGFRNLPDALHSLAIALEATVER